MGVKEEKAKLIVLLGRLDEPIEKLDMDRGQPKVVDSTPNQDTHIVNSTNIIVILLFLLLQFLLFFFKLCGEFSEYDEVTSTLLNVTTTIIIFKTHVI